MQDKQRGRHKLKIQDSKSGIVLLKRKTNDEDRKKQLMNYKTKGTNAKRNWQNTNNKKKNKQTLNNTCETIKHNNQTKVQKILISPSK